MPFTTSGELRLVPIFFQPLRIESVSVAVPLPGALDNGPGSGSLFRHIARNVFHPTPLGTSPALPCRYGTPETDGRWLHWNHAVLPHWDPQAAKRWASGTRFDPPDHLHSPYYPARGPYSSSDPGTIRVRGCAGARGAAWRFYGPATVGDGCIQLAVVGMRAQCQGATVPAVFALCRASCGS